MKPLQINSTIITNDKRIDEGDDDDNNDRVISIGNSGGNRSFNEISIVNTFKDTFKTPILWVVGVLVYIYFILFQFLSNGLQSMGYNTFALNNKFLSNRAIRLIPNRLKNRNKQISYINNKNNININNNNGYNSNSSLSSDNKSFNTLERIHFKKNFIVFISIQDNDKSALNIFNKVKSMFDNNQIGLLIFETENKSDTYRISYRIQQTEFDGIICVGDDNLIHDVVNCIFNKQDYTINRHIPIGVIPAGKKNGFSNSLGITSPEQAAKIIINGNVNYIDVMSASPIRNTNQLSFPNNNNNNNNNFNNQTQNNNNNNNVDINYQNNNNNLNSYNNIFFNEYKVYSILYIGWGVVSFRDKFKPWNNNFKPWLVSSIYSKFSNFSLNNFASSLYFLPSPHFSSIRGGKFNNDLITRNSDNSNGVHKQEFEYCSRKSGICGGCKKKYLDYDQQGKRSSKDYSDWEIIEGLDQENENIQYSNQQQQSISNKITFFLAGNLSHISKNFKAFPYSHYSDGYIDILISNQRDKKKLNQIIYDPSPSSDSLLIQDSDPLLKTTYCKTKEFILNVKNHDIPLSIDGELFDIKEFGSNTIKVQSHRGLCAIFS